MYKQGWRSAAGGKSQPREVSRFDCTAYATQRETVVMKAAEMYIFEIGISKL